eukprot:3937382-Rhodomonas_salina.2
MSALSLIQKRDGTFCKFDESKITSAINKAAAAVLGHDFDGALCQKIVGFVAGKCSIQTGCCTVEHVQDFVEQALISYVDTLDVCRAYILYRQVQQSQRNHHNGYDVNKIPDDVDTPW